MWKHFNRHDILTNLNHGFRAGFSCETQLLATTHDILTSFDNNVQTDVAVLDFSKAFDTVPHRSLLHKLSHYGIKGQLLNWLSDFLTNRTMRVVLDGETSREVHVKSGVPQGTVLGPLLFLCHVNDLPDVVSSQVRLFADDCLLYRPIKSFDDHLLLQTDLDNLVNWASTWGMNFNPSKCHILSVKNRSNYFYQLHGEILKQVPHTPYLGVNISEDMKWSYHVSKVAKKANSVLGFLRRNLRGCNMDCRKMAYTSLVRSKLEYASIVWDPYLTSDIDKLERVQRKAVRFIVNNYKNRETGFITENCRRLDLQSLQDRRKTKRLTFMFKVMNNDIPAIPQEQYFAVNNSGRRPIRAKSYKDFSHDNIVERYSSNNSRTVKVTRAKTEQFKNSFFVKTPPSWNTLSDLHVHSQSVEQFQQRLRLV